jgi:hypothetical protein
VDCAESYILHEDDNRDFTSPRRACDTEDTCCPVSGKRAGRYWYRVKARDASGDSDWSSARSVKVGPPDPPRLEPISDPDCNGDYTVSWSAADCAESYVLQEDDNEDFTSPRKVCDTDGTSCRVTAPAAGRYWYRVKARSPVGGSDWSNLRTIRVNVPGRPTLEPISNADCDGDYTVRWSAVGCADEYVLLEDDNRNFTSPTEYVVSGTSWSANDKPGGTTYWYCVKGRNAVGESNCSNKEQTKVCLPEKLWISRDCTVLEGLPSYSFCSVTDMWVGYEACVGARRARSMVALSDTDLAQIPPGTTISKAELYLFHVNYCVKNLGRYTVSTYRTTKDWSSPTWNSQPPHSTKYGSTSVETGDWKYYKFDVTDLVRGWVNGTIPNQGVMIRGPEDSSTSAQLGFATLNSSGTTYDPYIRITYPGMAAPEEGTPGVGEASGAVPCGSTIRDTLDVFPGSSSGDVSELLDEAACSTGR